MPGKPIKIGPLKGGLNNISLSGESRDDEVVDLVNLEVALDGSLTSRPPIEALSGATLPSTNTIGWEVLGVYRVSSTEWYLVVTCPTDGTTNVNTTVKAYLNGIVGTGETVLIIKNSTGINNRVISMCQFKDTVHFNVGTSATDLGFRWKKGDAIGGTTNTAMPRGNILISWKSRLWVAGTGLASNGDRVFFSTVDGTGPHPETWTVTTDFFDVAPGEGGFITAMIPSFNNIIIFKNDGTWRFTYATKPASGIVDKISGQVGCAGPNALVDFENYIYVYDQGRVYELMNSAFTQINRFVSFDLDPNSVDSIADGVELSVVNRRLLVRYFTSLYCFTIDTKVWSQWRSYSGTPGKFYELPADSASSESAQFMAASRGTMQSQSANLIADNLFKDPDTNTARSQVYNATVAFNAGVASLTRGADLTNTPVVLFNDDGVATSYDIPVSTSQHFNVALNVDTINVTPTVVRTNLCTNPSGEVDLSYWGPYRGALIRTSNFANMVGLVGTYQFQLTSDGTATTAGVNGAEFAVTAGQFISFRVKAWSEQNTSITPYIKINFKNSVGAYLTALVGATAYSPFYTGSEFILKGQIPVGAVIASVVIELIGTPTLPSGSRLWFDAALVQTGPTDDSVSNYNYFDGNTVTAGKTIVWTGTSGISSSTETTPGESIKVQVDYQYRDSSLSTDSTFAITAVGLQNHDYTAPPGAILARVSVKLDTLLTGGGISFHGLVFMRTSITAPFNLMRIVDEYPDQSNAVEYIDCYFQTKSYDFQAASNWKRMFWAGMDVKTSRTVVTESRPVATSTPTTWDAMEAYTWDQLEQGTWDNPLDWLGISVASINIQDPDSQLSENGRYFKKVAGAMRFRQISYIVRMSSLGNKTTGPAKFFSLTVYISPKEKVVDASN